MASGYGFNSTEGLRTHRLHSVSDCSDVLSHPPIPGWEREPKILLNSDLEQQLQSPFPDPGQHALPALDLDPTGRLGSGGSRGGSWGGIQSPDKTHLTELCSGEWGLAPPPSLALISSTCPLSTRRSRRVSTSRWRTARAAASSPSWPPARSTAAATHCWWRTSWAAGRPRST